MKKSVLFLIVFTSILAFNSKAQTPELWGVTSQGGTYDTGVMFKIDANGSNHQTVYNWIKYEGEDPESSLLKAANGKLYGLTESGGVNGFGVLFEYDPATNIYTKKYDFNGTNGMYPDGSLIQASNGKLYGLTAYGGVNNNGVLFEYDPVTNIYTKKYDFDGTNGSYPKSSLLQADNGKFYGMTLGGGANDSGVLFEYDLSTNTYSKKFDFDGTNGSIPFLNSLIQASNGKLYGMTTKGGLNNNGVLFEYNPITEIYTKKYDFDGTNGMYPKGSLIQADNEKLYGLTVDGGSNNVGVLFEFDPITEIYTKKYDFDGTNGSNPYGSLLKASNGKLYGITAWGGANDEGVLFEYDLSTNTLNKKFDFNNWNNYDYGGEIPYSSLIEVSNGELYGMTTEGGINATGVLFKYNLSTDTYTKVFDFDHTNGNNPTGLMQASNGKLYGVTAHGGANYTGILFEYDPTTFTYTKKLDFDQPFGTDGNYPSGSLMQASNGKLYGMTVAGGTNSYGVIFEYDPRTNTFTKKYDFDGINGDGNYSMGSLTQANGKKLYGLTAQGGINFDGVLFEYDPKTNTYTKKFDFDCYNSGSYPTGSLLRATNGKLYGTAAEGGANNYGVLFEYNPETDIYIKKYDFDGTNGSHPTGSLIQATNGKLYGMTSIGGINDKGVIFEFNPATDIYRKVYDFDRQNSVYYYYNSLMQATNGKLYGMTTNGGANDDGVLFEYDLITDIYTEILDFNGTNGSQPYGSLIELNTSMSIESQTSENIKITPNPTTSLVKISMTEKPAKISVVNMSGVLIYETDQTNKEMSIDMSNYAKAVYLVKIQTRKGVATYKVIKQ